MLGARIGRREALEFGGAGQALDEGLGDGEAEQALGILDREGVGHARAEVMAHHMGALDAEPIHQLLDVLCRRLLLVARRRRCERPLPRRSGTMTR